MGYLRPQTGQCAMHSCMAVSLDKVLKPADHNANWGGQTVWVGVPTSKVIGESFDSPHSPPVKEKTARTKKPRKEKAVCALDLVGRQSDASGFTEAREVYDVFCAVCNMVFLFSPWRGWIKSEAVNPFLTNPYRRKYLCLIKLFPKLLKSVLKI